MRHCNAPELGLHFLKQLLLVYVKSQVLVNEDTEISESFQRPFAGYIAGRLGLTAMDTKV